MRTTAAARFAAAYALLTAAHEAADYWIQQDQDAVAKGNSGRKDGPPAPGTSPPTPPRKPSLSWSAPTTSDCA